MITKETFKKKTLIELVVHRNKTDQNFDIKNAALIKRKKNTSDENV